MSDITVVEIDVPGEQGPVNMDSRVQTLGEVSGAVAIDLDAGGVVTATIAGATSFTFVGAAAAGINTTLMLVLTNPGAAEITWPESVDWGDDEAPILPASGRARLAFATEDAGANWDGVLSFVKTGS